MTKAQPQRPDHHAIRVMIAAENIVIAGLLLFWVGIVIGSGTITVIGIASMDAAVVIAAPAVIWSRKFGPR